MGIYNSSTALGSQIALARERVDSEINNRFQTADLANKAKQQTLANKYELGNNLVKIAGVELNKYNSESHNELTARGQNLTHENLVQNRSSEQARLNLAKEQMNVNTELALRKIRAGVMQVRNPTSAAVSMITNTNQQALAASNQDNNAMYNLNMAEIGEGQANTQRFLANKSVESNPMGELLMTGTGALLSSGLGTFGTIQGAKLAGIDPNIMFKK